MIARKSWSDKYSAWNRRWGAPSGFRTRKLVPKQLKFTTFGARLVGPFAFHPYSDTRALEYPWAFEALQITPGLRVLDIGGSLGGFQFVLDRSGCQVVNVDPGEESRGRGWLLPEDAFARLNHAFGTNVTLKKCFLHEASLADASFDRIVSISVLEHVPEADILTILAEVRRLLKPQGLFVLTLDLFLNVKPFADAASNEYGHNIDARWLIEQSGLKLIHGDKKELFGYPEFDPARILADPELFRATRYPVMSQTLVLQR